MQVGCAPRRACERRAAAASRQVALAAAKFARAMGFRLDSGVVGIKETPWEARARSNVPRRTLWWVVVVVVVVRAPTSNYLRLASPVSGEVLQYSPDLYKWTD